MTPRCAILPLALAVTATYAVSNCKPYLPPQDVRKHSATVVPILSRTDPAYGWLEVMQCATYQDDFPRWTGEPAEVEKMANLLCRLDHRSEAYADAGASADSDRLCRFDPKRAGADAGLAGGFESLLEPLLRNLGGALPTGREDPISWQIIVDVSRPLEKHLAARSPNWKTPRVGTLPLSSLNAQAVPFPAIDSSLVVVNRGLFSFVHEVVKVGLQTIPYSTSGKSISFDVSVETFDAGARRDPELLKRLSMALEDLVNQRRVRGHAPPDPVYDRVQIAMVNAIETFVLGHEFGHVMLRHLAEASEPLMAEPHSALSRTDDPAQKVLEARAINRSWGHEAAADAFGFMLLSELVRKDKTVCNSGGVDLSEYCLLAPLLFFELAQIADDAFYVFKHRQAPPRLTEPEMKQVAQKLLLSLEDEIGRGAADGGGGSQAGARGSDAGVNVTTLGGTHPPNWARRLFATSQWRATLPSSLSDDQRLTVELGETMMRNLGVMWADIMPIWVRIMQKLPPRPMRAPGIIAQCVNPYKAP